MFAGDDTTCATCEKPLPTDSDEEFVFDGFCSPFCERAYPHYIIQESDKAGAINEGRGDELIEPVLENEFIRTVETRQTF